jgi:hypothetical protein
MQEDFSFLFNDYINWITVWSDGNLDVNVSLTHRGRKDTSTFDPVLYSTIKYELVHSFPPPVGPVMIVISVVDPDTKQLIQKRDLLSSTTHHWTKGSKHSFMFQDCTYHNRKKPWALQIQYFVNNTLSLVKMSPAFMVYARKRDKRKRDVSELDEFTKILDQLVDITSKLDTTHQPKALKMICNGLI